MKTRKIQWVALAGVFLMSACTTSLNEVIEENLGVDLDTDPPILTDMKIETCWNHAELPGDGYKTLTPSEALGLSSVDGASDAQVQAFKACLPT